jgi:signal transduction histidine kinase
MRSGADESSANLEKRLADAESARDAALQELEQLKRTHAEFVTRTTHELRTPLNAILGFAQILESDSQLNPRQRRGISTILQSGHTLLALLDNLPKNTEFAAPRVRNRETAYPAPIESELDVEADAVPPQEELAVLHGLALAGSMREILERAQWIEGLDPRYWPFTRHVAALARAYESQRVLAFIARHHHTG